MDTRRDGLEKVLQVEMLAAIAETPKVVEKAKVRLSLLFDPLLLLLGQPQAVLTAAMMDQSILAFTSLGSKGPESSFFAYLR